MSPLARAALVNAIYFKAGWIDDFNPDFTDPGSFHLLNGSEADIEFMHGGSRTVYADGSRWSAVFLRYWGGASMLLIVPDKGEFASVEEGLKPTFVADVVGQMNVYDVDLTLPRWESNSRLKLVPPLQALGIHDAFDPMRADLSGVADYSVTGEPLFIGEAAHQANITVDEEGTEAAAATAIIDFGVSRIPEATLVVDRPFVYLIRDDVTGEILFLGRYLGPDAQTLPAGR